AVRARRAASFPAAMFRSEAALPLGLLAPTVIYLGLLILLPVAQAVTLSFQAADGSFGLDAYRKMWSDQAFTEAFRNTILLIVAIVPLQMVLALSMALLIPSRFPGHEAFLYIYALPLALSDLAARLVRLPLFTDRAYRNTIRPGPG